MGIQWIVFTLIGVAWSAISNAAPIAVNSDTCQTSMEELEFSGQHSPPETPSSIAPRLPPATASTWAADLGQPALVAPITRVRLAEAPEPNIKLWTALETREGKGQTVQPSLTKFRAEVSSDCPDSLRQNARGEDVVQSNKPQYAPAEEGLDALQSAGDGDSELGTLRVRERKLQPPMLDSNSELGTLRLRERELQPPMLDSNSELGTLRLREPEAQPSKLEVQSPQSQTTHLLARVGYFQTNNVFSGVDPVDDGLISSGLTFWAAPALGPKTDFVTAIDGNLIIYVNQSESNYNQLRFRAGVRQRLTPRMYGEIGWNNQQLFRAEEGGRFLNEDSIRLALYRRDRLNSRFALSTLYEFRFSNANPDSRSRMINSLLVSLSYYIQRNFQVGLDYQFGLSNFTQRQREDQYHRLLGRLTYAVSRDKQINVQGGLSLGGSSDPNINLDNFFFSVTYTVDLGQF